MIAEAIAKHVPEGCRLADLFQTEKPDDGPWRACIVRGVYRGNSGYECRTGIGAAPEEALSKAAEQMYSVDSPYWQRMLNKS